MLGFRFIEIRLASFTNIMLYSLTETIKDILSNHIKARYDYAISKVIVEQPPRAELGDLAFPLAFELAKKLRNSPKLIAEIRLRDTKKFKFQKLLRKHNNQ